MPHISLEYSANLEQRADIQALCEHLRAHAATIDALPMPGLRVRAIRCDHYAIADGDPKHAFIDISVRLRAGRSDDVKRDAAERLFAAAKTFLEPVLDTSSLALSLELRDIDPDLSPKTGTIRDHLGTV
ncbi:5-carboxymethyl-2-hydroxymuconate delta isomerase [Stappia aggregata IAM 12614]|uniref:5-carboxymethyl-2-hydroxymuconate delta isomerase n=1 Tax=Roseibium aggregatum (strain ATCC 25650 / DSM 13394 / JCM 20685 / NBRC 16684 / NCIMB 2208 / IAM 12614 / B1) TaxID=384765 RepID=A0NXR3_ROSAI|nr:5-carboxymethyl-2-hydroxymuconate Delta-isomerase [Roseibium aggregatum]EAV42257.1 5-carboxymethyl-2-hydroxymuconate delta isomerase [Stappia aggregata IAM 12614] [Roseibium aggregatum IAM 12614]